MHSRFPGVLFFQCKTENYTISVGKDVILFGFTVTTFTQQLNIYVELTLKIRYFAVLINCNMHVIYCLP